MKILGILFVGMWMGMTTLADGDINKYKLSLIPLTLGILFIVLDMFTNKLVKDVKRIDK